MSKHNVKAVLSLLLSLTLIFQLTIPVKADTVPAETNSGDFFASDGDSLPVESDSQTASTDDLFEELYEEEKEDTEDTPVSYEPVNTDLIEIESPEGEIYEGDPDVPEVKDEPEFSDEETPEKAADDDSQILSEQTEDRELSVKYFRMSDGTNAAVQYGTAVHEEGAEGNLVDIDNTLHEKKDKQGRTFYETERSAFSLAFAGEVGAKEQETLTLRLKEGTLRWAPVTDDETAAKAEVVSPYDGMETPETKGPDYSSYITKVFSDIVTYRDILPGVNLRYQLISNDIREDIVVSDRDAAEILCKNGFSYRIGLQDLSAELKENILIITDPAGKEVRRISAPCMTDSAGSLCTDINVSFKEGILTLHPSEKWLLSKERVYPVVIDPVIESPVPSSGMKSATVKSTSPTDTFLHGEPLLHVGRAYTYEKMRAALKFDLPTQVTENDHVVSAVLRFVREHNTYDESANGVRIDVHKITDSVNIDSLTWNGLNGHYSSTVLDSQITGPITQDEYFSFDVTAPVRSWYTDGKNYGLAFISQNENDAYKYAVLYSSHLNAYMTSYLPTVIIRYLDTKGLESAWTYHTMGSDTMGSISVCDLTGDLVYCYTDLSMSGNLMPVTIQHVYDHAQRNNANVVRTNEHFGLGMRLNLSQQILTSTVPGYPYRYVDEDGTEHYFTLKSGTSGAVGSKYEMENASDVILTVTDDTWYTLSLYGETECTFYRSTGKIRTVRDVPTGVTQTMTYSSGKLLRVTDGAGRQTNLSYDSNGYLTKIADPAGRETTYTYDSAHHLTRITRPDGEQVNLSYTSDDKLDTVTGTDGCSLKIGYYANHLKKVKTVTEYGQDGGAGGKLTFSYKEGSTKVTDRNGKSETMQFDTQGHTVSVMDHEGRGVFLGYENTNNNNKHSLKYQSELQSAVRNYLKNHSIEGSTSGWSVFCVSTGEGSMERTTAEKHSGLSSAKVTSTASGSYGLNQSIAVPGVRGKTLTLSMYVKVTSLSIPSGEEGGVYIRIRYKNPDGDYVTVSSLPRTETSSWKTMTVTAEIPEDAASETVQAQVVFRNATGTLYADDAQLETGPVANRRNLLENGHFRESTGETSVSGWSGHNLDSSTDKTAEGRLNTSGFQITGKSAVSKNLHQTVQVSGSAGTRFVFGAYAKASALPETNVMTGDKRLFGVKLRFYKADGTYSDKEFGFEARTSDWQYLSGSTTAPAAFEKVCIMLCYYYQENSVVFDDVQLFKDGFGLIVTHDDKGRVTEEKDRKGQKTTYTYVGESHRIETVTYPDRTKVTYAYDSSHKLKSIEDTDGKKVTYSYDLSGNVTKAAMTKSGTTLSSGLNTYTGSYLTSAEDPFGNTTTYAYTPSKGVLTSVTDPSGVTTEYVHNSLNDRLTTVKLNIHTLDGSALGVRNTYTYEDDRLKTIRHRTLAAETGDVVYSYAYNQFGRNTSVTVGNGTDERTLLTNSYQSYNGNLSKTTYGNGKYRSYTYDDLDRVASISYNGTKVAEYEYAADGRPGTEHDLSRDVTERYGYNTDGELTSVIRSNGERLYSSYTEDGKISKETRYVGSSKRSVIYDYTEQLSGQEREIVLEGITDVTGTLSYTYDSFGRASKSHALLNTGNTFNASYTFRAGSASNTTSLIPKYLTNSAKDTNGNTLWSHTLKYSYDAKGNITEYKIGSALKATYVYDELNQLIRENNKYLNKTVVYTYDRGGNIKSKKIYPYTTDETLPSSPERTVSYSYSDSAWKDLMTSYDGQTITYDAIGNPLTYRDGMRFTWQRGKELKTATTADHSITYQYDTSGIRTDKTVDGSTTHYMLSGDKVVYETGANGNLWYFYDADGSPKSFNLNGTGASHTYYYVKNLQGDVIAILDSNGIEVVKYTYDSWGKVLTITGEKASTVGEKNPYRYRGYRYDAETGLYYVNSRYYDPEVGRFISPDTTDVLTVTPMALTDKNLYAYCDNNPVVRIDFGGAIWETVFDVLSLGVSIVEVCVNPTDPWAWAGLVGDVVDLIPFVTGVGETTRGIKTTTSLIDKGSDVVSATRKTSKNVDNALTGSYEILYKSGKNYVGKGGFDRAITSAIQHAKPNLLNGMKGDEVVSIMWKAAKDSKTAFIEEYALQTIRGVGNSRTYNKIWSPGKKIIEMILEK